MTMPVPERIVLLDSVTEVAPDHCGSVVVTGSHGGLSAGRYALAVNTQLYVFNDAGVGKDHAGVAALEMLDAAGQPAVAVAHTTARIGEAADTWATGVISCVNAAARLRGYREGEVLSAAVARQLR
jgi:hypothetical protein